MLPIFNRSCLFSSLSRSCLFSFQFALAVVAVLGFVFRRILEKYFKNPSTDFPPNQSAGGRIHRSNYLTDQISETTPSLINETGNGNEIPEVVLQMPSAPPTYWEATKPEVLIHLHHTKTNQVHRLCRIPHRHHKSNESPSMSLKLIKRQREMWISNLFMFLNKLCLIIVHCETVLTSYKQSENVNIFLTQKRNCYHFVSKWMKLLIKTTNYVLTKISQDPISSETYQCWRYFLQEALCYK